MIIQSLVDYYKRKSRLDDNDLAPFGFEPKEIPFVLLIDVQGVLMKVLDTRYVDNKKKRAQSFLVPQGIKKTSGVAANFLWDNAEYVLGIGTKGKADRVAQQHQAFIDRLNQLLINDEGITAVKRFLANNPREAVQQKVDEKTWQAMCEDVPLMSFQLLQENSLVCEREEVVRAWLADFGQVDGEVEGVCLVNGTLGAVERMHPVIKGVWGAQTSGANIVSFNCRAFESYGKTERQGENAPMGREAVFSYTTALNALLSRDSLQRVQVGDASTVFWATSPCAVLENGLKSMVNDDFDDPDACTNAVKALYQSIKTGELGDSSNQNYFCVLGLAPNAARISVRFWHQARVSTIGNDIRRHFEDLEIEHASFEPEHLPLFKLLRSVAVLGKADNIPPNLAGEMFRAVIQNMPYPASVFQGVMRRIIAERKITYERAALLKGYFNRLIRFDSPLLKNWLREEFNMSLDLQRKDVHYRLGRLFAVLEMVQERANPGRDVNATIRDRFYGRASSNPRVVFAHLMKLNVHHLSKISKQQPGSEVFFEKLIAEIVQEVIDFPLMCSLMEQGVFALGYYHQKHDLYKKKSVQDSTQESAGGETEKSAEKLVEKNTSLD